MKVRYLLLFMLLGGLLALQFNATQANITANHIPDDPLRPETTTQISSRLLGSLISLGTSWENDRPALAYSTDANQYLLVFHSVSGASHSITGRYLDGTGNPLGSSFTIASSFTNELNNPDVAYDSYRNRFLVVWDEFGCTPATFRSEYSPELDICNQEIKGQLLTGQYLGDSNQFVGKIFVVAMDKTSHHYGYYDPAVAYNQDDHEYLVVFTTDDGTNVDFTTDIFGQMLSTAYDEPEILGSDVKGFAIRGYAGYQTFHPDVAWSSTGDTFVATWTTIPSGDEQRYIAAAYLQETYQDSTQVYQVWNISSPQIGHATSSAVAFDSTEDAYVVVFGIRGSNVPDTANTHIRAQRLRSDYVLGEFRKNGEGSFLIEAEAQIGTTTIIDHDMPDITPAGLGGKMQVVYYSVDYNDLVDGFIHNRTLKGTVVGERLQVRYTTGEPDELFGSLLLAPRIACEQGYCLTVWEEEYTGDESEDRDNLGQMLAPDCYSFTSSVSPREGGIVSVSPPPNCDGQYLEETSLAVLATPAAGYTFSHWSGDAEAETPDLIFLVREDTSITANFTKISEGDDFVLYLPVMSR